MGEHRDEAKNSNTYLNKEQKECIVELHKKGKEISRLRNRPLVLMFYSKEVGGSIDEDDLYELENKLDERIPLGVEELDVIIQTTGGDANTSYLLAQLLREYCSYMETLIPNYAYSGGTLISLASDKIILGKTARISPIDLQLSYGGSEKISPFALVDIEKYIDFINDSCDKFQFQSEENKTAFITPLVKELVGEHGTKKLGELFRMRGLTEFHARILLMDYMLKNFSNRKERATHIIKRLTSESPTHDFEIDYNIAKKVLGLSVEQMEGNLYKLTRHLISMCDKAKGLGLICSFTSSKDRKPYFEVFLPNAETEEKNEQTK